MTNKFEFLVGWTSEALLEEESDLLKEYDLIETQEEKDNIDGCLRAIKQVLLTRKGEKK